MRTIEEINSEYSHICTLAGDLQFKAFRIKASLTEVENQVQMKLLELKKINEEANLTTAIIEKEKQENEEKHDG